jgi:hypothetical protein
MPLSLPIGNIDISKETYQIVWFSLIWFVLPLLPDRRTQDTTHYITHNTYVHYSTPIRGLPPSPRLGLGNLRRNFKLWTIIADVLENGKT